MFVLRGHQNRIVTLQSQIGTYVRSQFFLYTVYTNLHTRLVKVEISTQLSQNGVKTSVFNNMV